MLHFDFHDICYMSTSVQWKYFLLTWNEYLLVFFYRSFKTVQQLWNVQYVANVKYVFWNNSPIFYTTTFCLDMTQKYYNVNTWIWFLLHWHLLTYSFTLFSYQTKFNDWSLHWCYLFKFTWTINEFYPLTKIFFWFDIRYKCIMILGMFLFVSHVLFIYFIEPLIMDYIGPIISKQETTLWSIMKVFIFRFMIIQLINKTWCLAWLLYSIYQCLEWSHMIFSLQSISLLVADTKSSLKVIFIRFLEWYFNRFYFHRDHD